MIVDHHPPVFVMENVKGLLSAKIAGKPIINRIVGDLASPKKAVGNSASGLGYRLYSLSEDEMPGDEVDPRLFLVRAEDYGVPQARHRMFIVGIRSDLNIRPGRLRPHAPPTVRETIGGLPSLRSSLSKGGDSVERWRSEIAKLSPSEIKHQLNGSAFTHGDCHDFRVWAGIMGKKESHYVTTQRAGDPGRSSGSTAGRQRR
ncbi:MAG: DNA cytosine methyltransferase, partial [Novosphingobium sp.]